MFCAFLSLVTNSAFTSMLAKQPLGKQISYLSESGASLSITTRVPGWISMPIGTDTMNFLTGSSCISRMAAEASGWPVSAVKSCVVMQICLLAA